MRRRILISLLLCLSLAWAGCSAPGAEPAAPPADPGPTASAPEDASAPPATAAPEESPTPTANISEATARSFPFAAMEGNTAYWCTGYGILSVSTGGQPKVFSEVKGRRPVIMDGSLYVVEDQTDTTEDAAWPVSPDAVTESRILRIPLAGGEAQEVYSTSYVNILLSSGGRLYFSTTQGEGLMDAGGLFSIDPDGQNEALLAEDCVTLSCVQDGYAYYMGLAEETSALHRINLDGGQSEKVLSVDGMPRTPIAGADGVYYIHYDWAKPEDPHNLCIMRLSGEQPAPLGDIRAQELLGIWGGKLYYVTAPLEETPSSSLACVDLTSQAVEALAQNVMEVAALSGTHVAYSADAPLILSKELNLLPLSGGEPTKLGVEGIVESQG